MILVTYYALLFWWHALLALLAVYVTRDPEKVDAELRFALEAACNVISRGISPRLLVLLTVTAPDGSGALYASNTEDARSGLKPFLRALDEHDRLKQASAEALHDLPDVP